MYALLLALAGACGESGERTPSFRGSYDVQVRDDLPAPADQGDAPFAGSLGPPAHMVVPVAVGPATTTREGSAGPPVLAPGAERMLPTPYNVRGLDHDAHRVTTEISPGK